MSTPTATTVRPRRPARPADATGGDLASELRLAVGRLGRRLRQQAVGGLSPSQVSALATLDNHGAMPMGRLSRHEAVSAPTMTRIVDRLEEQALVARSIDPDDARSTVVTLTPPGRRALVRVRKERTAYLAQRLDTFDDAEVAALVAALPALRKLAEGAE